MDNIGKSGTKYFNWEPFQIKSVDLLQGNFRLNAEFYEKNYNFNLDNKIKFKPLAEFATVIFPGIFKRIIVDCDKNGIGFLTTSEMMMIEPVPEKFLSIDLTLNLDIYKVDYNTLLVSRSGTIGNTIYVNNDLINYAITEDALRVLPFHKKNIGLLYFYFLNEYGNGLITGKKSGAVIDHIYEDDLLKIPVPLIDLKHIEILYSTFIAIKEKREVANNILRKARKLVLEYNNLPSIDAGEVETLDPEKEIEIRNVNISEFTSDYRLDAHFYNPMAKKAVDNIAQYSNTSKVMFELADCSFRGGRSARNYVHKEHGTPFLSGKNIIQIRPDLKYLSKTETSNLDEMIVQKNWILITRSGTLGRTVYVWNNYEEFAASEHLIRVVPNTNIIDPGYLYAFLSSEYGYHQLLRYKHGAVIDEITEDQVSQTLIPISNKDKQIEIGDLVRQAYSLRAEAIRLEDEAQEILTNALTGK